MGLPGNIGLDLDLRLGFRLPAVYNWAMATVTERQELHRPSPPRLPDREESPPGIEGRNGSRCATLSDALRLCTIITAVLGLTAGCCPHKQALAPKTAHRSSANSPGDGGAHHTSSRRPGIRLPRRLSHPETIKALRQAGIAPAQIRCNDRVVWLPELAHLARRAADEIGKHEGLSTTPEAAHQRSRIILGYMVRMVFQYIGTQNVGAVALKGLFYRDKQGTKMPLLVFRSGVTTDAAQRDSCLRSLLQTGGVKHIVNLYGGHFPFHELIRSEKKVANAVGVTHYDAATSGCKWRGLIKTPKRYKKNRAQAMAEVATLIREQLLMPGGKPPRGNLYLHCGGGMHRSGMVFGVLRRCVNGDPMALIEAEYKRHTAYRSETRPGGYEPLNLQFIKEFDCSLLASTLAELRK